MTAAGDVGADVYTCACGCFFVDGPARQKLCAWLKIDEQLWSMILAQGKRGPPCVCGLPMQTASLKGVVVDGCVRCGGLLLDPGELRALTGMNEPAQPSGTTTSLPPAAEPIAGVGRTYLPSRDALGVFLGGARALRLAQSVSDVGGALLGARLNQPFSWIVESGASTATIGPDDDSMARQLLAFVTKNAVSSRYLLKDARDNPLLVFVRSTKALVSARVDVLWADDERPLGTLQRSVVGWSLDAVDAREQPALRFEKRLGDVWGFTLVDPAGRPIGDVARNFANLEYDMPLIGDRGFERSLRRDDYDLTLDDAMSLESRALAVAGVFLVAHVTG